jgi:hypothetical protein
MSSFAMAQIALAAGCLYVGLVGGHTLEGLLVYVVISDVMAGLFGGEGAGE